MYPRHAARLVSVLILFVWLLTACRGALPINTSIKIGAIHDLTGATSVVGIPYAEGMRDYVGWLNAQGGVDGRTVELISADYAYDVDTAKKLYSWMVDQGVVAFMGWGTGDTEALRPRLAVDRIPFMSASYSADLGDIRQFPYNFLVGVTYSEQAMIAMRWALDDWQRAGNAGAPKIALAYHDSPFGESPLRDAEAYADANGIKLLTIRLPNTASDYLPELEQIKAYGADYVIVHTVSSPAAVLLKEAESQGFKPDLKFICLNWCADEAFIQLAGQAAEDVIGAIPFAPPGLRAAGHEDAAAWLAENGASLDEKGLHYTQGWWTMAVMLEGVRRVVNGGQEVSRENLKAALETIQDFNTGGVTAPISFSPTSHTGNHALRLYQVHDGKWKLISDTISSDR